MRLATPDDAPAIAEIDRACVAAGSGMVRGLDAVRGVAAWRRRLEQEVGAQSLERWVVELEGEVVGYGTVHHFGGWCSHVGTLALHIHPGAQGRGLGRRLWEQLMVRGRQQGLTRLQLFTRADNARAIALYRSCGFEVEGRRRAMVRLPDGTFVDDLMMAALVPPCSRDGAGSVPG
jgi:putative acetyltransferase